MFESENDLNLIIKYYSDTILLKMLIAQQKSLLDRIWLKSEESNLVETQNNQYGCFESCQFRSRSVFFAS